MTNAGRLYETTSRRGYDLLCFGTQMFAAFRRAPRIRREPFHCRTGSIFPGDRLSAIGDDGVKRSAGWTQFRFITGNSVAYLGFIDDAEGNRLLLFDAIREGKRTEVSGDYVAIYFSMYAFDETNLCIITAGVASRLLPAVFTKL